jgi:histidinol-phosphatase
MPNDDADGRLADLALAQRAALAGGELGLRYFARVSQLAQDLKADGTIVTEADRAVEGTVRRILLEARPEDACLGEETGESGSGQRRWILDGIDGTALFVRGDDSWQSLIALEVDGQITVGVAILPAQGQIWWAVRGGGAFVSDIEGSQLVRERRLAVSPAPAALAASRLGIVPPYAALPAERQAFVARLVAVTPPRGGPLHPALLVASGEVDVVAQVMGSVWDFAALSLIVEEAGGTFSGLDGQGHPVVGTAIFANDPAIQAAALAHLAV